MNLEPRHPGLLQHVREACGDRVARVLAKILDKRWTKPGHGDLPRWQEAVRDIQEIIPPAKRGWRVEDGLLQLGKGRLSASGLKSLEQALQSLMPWRKGPFNGFSIRIDSEWRSDWKWQRIRPHLPVLSGMRVLDVGAGNGYFGYRLLQAGARSVIAVDPGWLFVMQHQAMQAMSGPLPNWVLPLGLEDLPDEPAAFDLVLSLGVLYHRRDPGDHLRRLRQRLRPGGRLVLETLVLPPGQQAEINPGRYARMRNVHHIPQPGRLRHWLHEAGFTRVKLADICRTTTAEQRGSAWMRFESLPEALDPGNPALTIEGLPAPRRAVVFARHESYSTRNS